MMGASSGGTDSTTIPKPAHSSGGGWFSQLAASAPAAAQWQGQLSHLTKSILDEIAPPPPPSSMPTVPPATLRPSGGVTPLAASDGVGKMDEPNSLTVPPADPPPPPAVDNRTENSSVEDGHFTPASWQTAYPLLPLGTGQSSLPATTKATDDCHDTRNVDIVEVVEWQQPQPSSSSSSTTAPMPNNFQPMTSRAVEVDHQPPQSTVDHSSQPVDRQYENTIRELQRDVTAYEEAMEEMRVAMDRLERENAQLRELHQQSVPPLATTATVTTDNVSTDAALQQAVVQREQVELQLAKANADCSRLMSHLSDLEQSHNAELTELAAEIDLKSQQLSDLQSQLWHSEQSAREAQTDDGALAELQREYRDRCAEADGLREEVAELRQQLDNLQSVLDGYEMAKRSEMELVVGSLKNQLTALKTQLFSTQSQAQRAQTELAAFGMSAEEVAALQQRHKEQTLQVEQLQKQVANLSTALSSSFPAAVSPSGSSNSPLSVLQAPRYQTDQTTVDKRVVVNLLLQYFNAGVASDGTALYNNSNNNNSDEAERRRDDILRLMTKMLDFTDEERVKLGLVQDAHGVWQRRKSVRQSADAASSSANSTIKPQSLTDAFLSFLLTEARTEQPPN